MLLGSVFAAVMGVTPAAAQSAPGSGAWQPGPAASGDRNSIGGVIDAPTAGATLVAGNLTISGWVVDTTAQGWTGIDDVEVFVGTLESGRPLGHAQFQVSRPDVANALKNPFWSGAGFVASISTLGLPAGATTLSVYAHTPGRGWWFPQLNLTLRATATTPPKPAQAVTGNDISYPQCPTGSEPPPPAFGIVGVTGGRPFSPNPCLPRQFVWALSATSPNQPHLGLYMNTADPGPGTSPNWPQAGTTTPRACDGSWSDDCAYDYGWASAQDAFGRAVGVSGTAAAAQYPWWLDVEAANSWAPQNDANAATLQGAIDFFHSMNIASVGIYSTSTDWEALIGPPSASGPFGALLNWRPGPSNLQDAPGWCARTVTGGRVKLVQFPTSGFDTDYACF